MLAKEEIFEALITWNYWDRPLPGTVNRPVYPESRVKRTLFNAYSQVL
jgi:hypothetical protein